MEENKDNLEVLEEELGDAPPILQNYNNETPNEPKNKIEILEQDKKLKLDLIATKEKEIEQLKKDIEEIDVLIEKYKSQIIEQNEIKIETEEEIKNQEKSIKENISLLFEKYKVITKTGNEKMNCDSFIENNKEIISKIFFVEDANGFYYFFFETIKDNTKLKEYMDIINKKQNIIKNRSLFIYNEIRSFFKRYSKEKDFFKILLLGNKYANDQNDEIDLRIQSIKHYNILILDEYIKSSKENKILFLKNAIDKNEGEIKVLLDKAKESLKIGKKDKAKLFLKEKKYIIELLEQYKNELNKLI